MTNTTFDLFSKKRLFWIECFLGQDNHAIIQQIYRMVWNAAVFNVINEARRIAPKDAQGNIEFNGMIHRFIDTSFFNSQLLAIRRLSDKYPLTGEKGVYSLVALLSDMKDNVKLLTRENFFAGERLEYDVDKIKQKEMEFHSHKIKEGVSAYWIPSNVDTESIERRHREIDILTGVSKESRSRNDCVQENILDYLIAKIQTATGDINQYVNQFIAHAASRDSRNVYDSGSISLTLEHLWSAHKIICQVANLTDTYLLSRSSHTFLPTPQYDQFQFIENPLATSANIEQLDNAWRDFGKETETWEGWGLKQLRDEMNNTKV